MLWCRFSCEPTSHIFSPNHLKPPQNVENHKAGVSDINKEIIAHENGRFVLHDSQGFEPGEVKNFQKVITFLQTRKGMVDVRDQVHAIWYGYYPSIIS